MKIYIKNKKGESEEVTMRSLIEQSLSKSEYKVESDGFSDGSASWVSIIKYIDNKELRVNIIFNGDNEITKLNACSTPMITGDSNSTKLNGGISYGIFDNDKDMSVNLGFI